MPSSEELIAEIHKINAILNSSDTNWDVIEVTQLFKSLGFQLDHLDFDTTTNGEANHPNLTLEIRCGLSHIVSRLTSSAQRDCLCPANGHSSSFWEVQGTAPSVHGMMNGNTKEKSSNLLPEVTKAVNEGVKILMGAALHLLKASDCLHEIDSHPDKENKVPGAATVKIEDIPEIPEKLDTSSSTQILSASPKDNVLATSIRANNDRDIRVIQQLSEARYKIDQALLMLKLNGQSDGGHNSLLLVTPQKPSSASSPRLSSIKKSHQLIPDIFAGSSQVKERKTSIGSLSLLPPRSGNTLKRRSVGSLMDSVPQPPKRDPPAIRVTPSGSGYAKKKLTVKENITSNLRKSMTSQSMPKLPTKK